MNRDKLDFGNGRIDELFKALFFPTLVGMVFNSLLNICDGMFVGHGVGSNALAAINIVAPLFLVCTGVGLMFGIGASVIGSIRLAENNVKAARIIMTQAYIAGALIFGVVILVSLLFTRPVLYMLGCSPLLEDLASDYLLWLLPGLMFFYLQCVGMMLIRLDGSPKYAMSVQIVAAVINIVLDWVMVFPMGMGIKGASIATSLSCIIGGLMVLVYFLRFSDKLKFYRLKLSWKSLRLSLRNTVYMMKIGLATFIAELSLGVMIVTGNLHVHGLPRRAGCGGLQHRLLSFPDDILDKQRCRTGLPAHHQFQLRCRTVSARESGAADCAAHGLRLRSADFAGHVDWFAGADPYLSQPF